ncbi:MAG: trans-sulfuration enzyme family protein [Candidatus Nanopelagicaceae bacterium]
MKRHETLAVTAGRPAHGPDAPLNPSIQLTSTFIAGGELGYGRYGNEAWSALEAVISELEGGRTLTFSSGMAAISAVFNILPIGAVVTASNQGYSGTMSLLKQSHESGRLEVRFVNLANTQEVIDALPGTQLLWLESPTNPCLEVADLPNLIKAAKAANIGVAVDNTFATPLNQNPLEMGADIVMNSVTKFLAGHSDVLMGSLSTKDEALFTRLEGQRKLGGAIPGPFEAWLALRGVRTFAVRVQRGSESALEIAKRLSAHPKVSRVRYPGLPTDPQHERAKSFMRGFGAVLSFEIKGGASQAELVCESSKLITHATSLGGVETLWERRRRWPAESSVVPESLIRLSVGLENVDDLWRDIEQALSSI